MRAGRAGRARGGEKGERKGTDPSLIFGGMFCHHVEAATESIAEVGSRKNSVSYFGNLGLDSEVCRRRTQ